MRWKLLGCSAVSVGSIIPIVALVSAVFAQDVPYIYYYSRDDQAFMSARADGSDQEEIIPFTLQEEYLGELGIYGDGWSASGELFAWIVGRSEGGPSIANNLYVYAEDGTEVDTLSFETQTRQGVYDFRWSPTQDVLAIVIYDTSDVLAATLLIYDATTAEYSNQFTPLTISSRDVRSLQWSHNGRYVVVIYDVLVMIVNVETGDITSFSNLILPVGQLIEVQEVSNGEPLLVVTSTSITPPQVIVSDGVLFNPDTREIIDLHTVDNVPADLSWAEIVRWHPDGTHYFLGSMYNAMEFIRTGDTTGVVSPDLALCPRESRSCYGWLPEEVNP